MLPAPAVAASLLCAYPVRECDRGRVADRNGGLFEILAADEAKGEVVRSWMMEVYPERSSG